MASKIHRALTPGLFVASWAVACADDDPSYELVVEPVVRFCAYDSRDQVEPDGRLKRNKAELRLRPGRYRVDPHPQSVPFEFRGLGGSLSGTKASDISIEPPQANYPFIYYKSKYEYLSGIVDINIGTSYRGSTERTYRVGEIDQVFTPGLMNLVATFNGSFPELAGIGPTGKFSREFGSCDMAFRPDDIFTFEFPGDEKLELVVRSQFIQAGPPKVHGRLISARGTVGGRIVDETRYEYLAFNFNANTAVLPPPGLSILWDEYKGTCGLNLVYTIYGPVKNHGYSAYILDCSYLHLEEIELVSAAFDQTKYIDLHEDGHPPATDSMLIRRAE